MSFKNLQVWRFNHFNHFPGQLAPRLDIKFGEEIFPNRQSKPPLEQFVVISSHSISCCLGEKTNVHLVTAFFQVVVENGEVLSEPSLLFSRLNNPSWTASQKLGSRPFTASFCSVRSTRRLSQNQLWGQSYRVYLKVLYLKEAEVDRCASIIPELKSRHQLRLLRDIMAWHNIRVKN